jgi:beta-galactosidase
VEARVALVWDWPSWWAASSVALPTARLDPFDALRSWYRPLWEADVAVDIVAPDADLSLYRAVIAPSLYLVDEERAHAFARYTAAGGVLAVGPFSAVADPTSTLHVGRFPVPLTGLLGVSGEEWVPLPDAGVPASWTGSSVADGGPFIVHTYAEQTRSDGAEPIITLAAAPGAHQLQDAVAVARNVVGEGVAWYVGAVLPHQQLASIIAAVLADAGVEPTFAGGGPELEVVRRGRHLFVLNHSDSDLAVPGASLARALGLAPGAVLRDLLSSASIPTTADGVAHTLAAHDVRVLEESP